MTEIKSPPHLDNRFSSGGLTNNSDSRIAQHSKIFNGQFPFAAMLTFHRSSFGITTGKLHMEFTFKNGFFEDVKAWRGLC